GAAAPGSIEDGAAGRRRGAPPAPPGRPPPGRGEADAPGARGSGAAAQETPGQGRAPGDADAAAGPPPGGACRSGSHRPGRLSLLPVGGVLPVVAVGAPGALGVLAHQPGGQGVVARLDGVDDAGVLVPGGRAAAA